MSPARPLDKLATGLAFVLGLATILGALGSQFIGGLVPCELCLEQRLPYYWGLPLLALILLLWNRAPLRVWFVAMLIATAIFAWSTFMGAFHAGVEWGFWLGPTECSGTVLDLGKGSLLENLDRVKVVRCDQAQWRFLGLSLAGYNALISLLMAAISGWGIAALAGKVR